ncbi:MAG: UDP-N-acetylmuramate--L-alanine ligase [Bacteroidales bacterium]|nr:UDP-N-acetylmuramate--L-alanine ligase [Bacteroidales bacterium]
MDPDKVREVYMLGIGGIGMSSLARYFLARGAVVAGYDRAMTRLTRQLESEGAQIHYEDNPELIPYTPDLVILTPAVPSALNEYLFLRRSSVPMLKRSEVLGAITSAGRLTAVAGSHGKTTVSTMIAHILRYSGMDATAFLGGISKNYQSNFLSVPGSRFFVAEADEYDRSFLQLRPETAVITSMDPDHMDIYGTYDEMKRAFRDFTGRIEPGGNLVLRAGIDIQPDTGRNLNLFSYSAFSGGDFHAENVTYHGTASRFDLLHQGERLDGINLHVPGQFNIENAVGAAAAGLILGISPVMVRKALESYRGVVRRFDVRMDEKGITFIDDYAHHPAEIEALIRSIRLIYPGRKITGVFQPHLFSRTRELAAGFGKSLGLLDEVILLEIYPARETPIPGVTSELILKEIKGIKKWLVGSEALLMRIDSLTTDVLVTMGAGDIDQWVPAIEKKLRQKINTVQ